MDKKYLNSWTKSTSISHFLATYLQHMIDYFETYVYRISVFSYK